MDGYPAAGTQLVTIDTTTGTHTVVGPLGGGIADVDALAFSEQDGKLNAIDDDTENLLRIEPSTGAASVVGNTGTTWGTTYGMTCKSTCTTPTYDVYLWRDLLKPALICTDASQPTCDPGTLKYCTRYYWRVVAKNCCGETQGPFWSFTTVPYPCWNSPTQCHGDADYTGDVKGSDFLCLKNSWYKCYPDPLYNPCWDFDRNGCVKGSDFLTLKNNWYQSVPPDCAPGGSCPPGAGK